MNKMHSILCDLTNNKLRSHALMLFHVLILVENLRMHGENEAKTENQQKSCKIPHPTYPILIFLPTHHIMAVS